MNKVSCLNLAAYNLAAYKIKAFNKPYNKTVIPYNHFKGSKRDFNYNLYKSTKSERYWLIAMLKGFKIGINKIFRLKIYGWGLVERVLLISSFGWSDVITKRYGRKSLEFAKSGDFGYI